MSYRKVLLAVCAIRAFCRKNVIYLLSCESNLIFDKAAAAAASSLAAASFSDEEETTTIRPLVVIASFVRRPFKFSNIKRKAAHIM